MSKASAFALLAELLTLYWLGQGAAYEVTSLDMMERIRHTTSAATASGYEDAGELLIDEVVRQDDPRAASGARVVGVRIRDVAVLANLSQDISTWFPVVIPASRKPCIDQR